MAEELLKDGDGHVAKRQLRAVVVAQGVGHGADGHVDASGGAQPAQEGVDELLVERGAVVADEQSTGRAGLEGPFVRCSLLAIGKVAVDAFDGGGGDGDAASRAGFGPGRDTEEGYVVTAVDGAHLSL